LPRYTYTARAAGQAGSQDGKLDAFSRREALHLLQARGLQVVRLDEEGGPARPAAGSAAGHAAVSAKKLSTKERLPFLEALVDLVNAGLSAGEAVRLLAVRLSEPKLKSLCAALWARLGEGSTLSTAMGEHPAVFDKQTVNLIAAGEATGNLKEVLSRLIQHFTEQRDLRAKFAATLAYPAFICFLGGGVVLFLLFFLVPRLQTLLGSLGGKLPFATRLLVNGSRFLLFYGPFIAIALVIGGIFFLRWRQTPEGQKQTDIWLLRAPIIRDFVIQAAILNFAHTLAVLIENGVTTAEALRLTERAVENTRVQEILHEATDRVIEGSSLCASLQRTNLVPPLFLDRLAVGEQTGNLAPSLRQIAQSYQVDLSRRLQNATRLMSGTVLFLTFGFVAFLAYAIVTALFQVSASFRL
jgi:type II secretory pathway component PulF